MVMAEHLELHPSNDMWLSITGMQDPANGIFLNTASVQVTLVDKTSLVPITGQSWPVMLMYVTGSNGDYRAVLSRALDVEVHQELRALCVIDNGAGFHAESSLPVVVAERGLSALNQAPVLFPSGG